MINNGSNPDKTYIFSKTSLSHSNLNLYAHVYYDSLTSLTPLGKITGSVVTNATTVLLSGGNNIVNGLLYAPKRSCFSTKRQQQSKRNRKSRCKLIVADKQRRYRLQFGIRVS